MGPRATEGCDRIESINGQSIIGHPKSFAKVKAMRCFSPRHRPARLILIGLLLGPAGQEEASDQDAGSWQQVVGAMKAVDKIAYAMTIWGRGWLCNQRLSLSGSGDSGGGRDLVARWANL